jgi:hypothetical protein
MSGTAASENIGTIYSNFDHELDKDAEAKLRAGAEGHHTAWDHFGVVWFDGEQFVEAVWRYGAEVARVRGPDLLAVIAQVNDEWGCD